MGAVSRNDWEKALRARGLEPVDDTCPECSGDGCPECQWTGEIQTRACENGETYRTAEMPFVRMAWLGKRVLVSAHFVCACEACAEAHDEDPSLWRPAVKGSPYCLEHSAIGAVRRAS